MSDDSKRLIDPSGKPLTKPKKSWFRRIHLTALATWLTFVYVFVIRGDELVSMARRWFVGPGDLTVVEFRHIPGIDHTQYLFPPNGPRRTTKNDTDFVDLEFKVVNHSQQTILIDRVEVELDANGTLPEGRSRTAILESSAEYPLAVPNLQPSEQAVRYVNIPHVLKPNDVDAFNVHLLWPHHVDIAGTYSIKTRLITSVGVTELDSFDVPVLSDRVQNDPVTTNASKDNLPPLPPLPPKTQAHEE